MPELPKTLEQIKWIRAMRREDPNRKIAIWEGPDGMKQKVHTLQQYIDKPNDTTYFKLNRFVSGKPVPSLPIGQPRSYMLLYAAGRIWSSENNGTKNCRRIEGHLKSLFDAPVKVMCRNISWKAEDLTPGLFKLFAFLDGGTDDVLSDAFKAANLDKADIDKKIYDVCDEMETRLKGLIAGVETRVGAVETRVGAVETRVGAVETRVDAVVEDLKADLKAASDRIDTLFELKNDWVGGNDRDDWVGGDDRDDRDVANTKLNDKKPKAEDPLEESDKENQLGVGAATEQPDRPSVGTEQSFSTQPSVQSTQLIAQPPTWLTVIVAAQQRAPTQAVGTQFSLLRSPRGILRTNKGPSDTTRRLRVNHSSVSHCVNMNLCQNSVGLGLINRRVGIGLCFLHESESVESGNIIRCQDFSVLAHGNLVTPRTMSEGPLVESLTIFPSVILVDWKLKWEGRFGVSSAVVLDLGRLGAETPGSSMIMPSRMFWENGATVRFSSTRFIGQTIPARLSGLCHGSLVLVHTATGGIPFLALLLGTPNELL
jgi:hypothetical protein